MTAPQPKEQVVPIGRAQVSPCAGVAVGHRPSPGATASSVAASLDGEIGTSSEQATAIDSPRLPQMASTASLRESIESRLEL